MILDLSFDYFYVFVCPNHDAIVATSSLVAWLENCHLVRLIRETLLSGLAEIRTNISTIYTNAILQFYMYEYKYNNKASDLSSSKPFKGAPCSVALLKSAQIHYKQYKFYTSQF